MLIELWIFFFKSPIFINFHVKLHQKINDYKKKAERGFLELLTGKKAFQILYGKKTGFMV